MFAGRLGKGQYTGDRPPHRAENPARDQSRENNGGGLGENRKKLLDKRRPCRYSGIHTNLRVVYGLCLPLQPSVGWYVFVNDSWPWAA